MTRKYYKLDLNHVETEVTKEELESELTSNQLIESEFELDNYGSYIAFLGHVTVRIKIEEFIPNI